MQQDILRFDQELIKTRKVIENIGAINFFVLKRKKLVCFIINSSSFENPSGIDLILQLLM